MTSPQTGDHRDLRARLAAIPRIDERPVDRTWLAPGDPPPDGRPESAPLPDGIEGSTPAPERRRGRRWPWIVGLLAVAVVGAVAIPALMAWRTFESIERVPLAGVLADPTDGRNLLLVGTDSREGIDPTVDNAGLILGGGTEGRRSDTIMILRFDDGGGSRIVSLPRDLWLDINRGGPQRINTAIAQGPGAVVTTVREELGIPVTNYVQIEMAGFLQVVDAIGGITITIPHPAFDRASGLDLPVAGDVTLDSAQALAYVRSRRYTEVIDGREVPDPTSDLGRVQRQQEFLRALFAELSAQRNPIVINQVVNSLADAVKIDDRMSFGEVVDLARRLRDGLPESVTLPTRPASIDGRSVLLLDEGSHTILEQFRTGAPR